MTRQEKFNDIKNKIISLTKMFSKEEKFDVTTKDGNVLTSPDETIIVGSEIYTIDETGSQIPASDGDYELSDGTLLVVAGGVVTEIKPAEAEIEAETQTEDVVIEAEEATTPEKTDLELRVEALESGIKQVLELLNQTNMTSQDLSNKLEEFSKQPAAEPIQRARQVEREMTPEEIRTKRFMDLKNSLKS